MTYENKQQLLKPKRRPGRPPLPAGERIGRDGFFVYLTTDLKEWVQEQGGSTFVRNLLEAYRKHELGG